MELVLCPRNHRRDILAAPGSLLCRPCIIQLTKNLRELPRLHEELLSEMVSPPRRVNPTKVSGSRTRDHLNMDAFETRHDVLAILNSWAGMIIEELGAPPPARSVLDLTRFLLRHLDWLTAQPPAADFADEIERLHTESQSVANPESEDSETYALKCGAPGCPGTIDPSARRAGGNGSTLTCSFGHSWNVSEWLTLRDFSDDERDST
jgi:hypothetical protein